MPPVRENGSLALGVALAWLINVIGGLLMYFVLATVTRSPFNGSGWPMLAIPLPFIASVALGTWMLVKGPRRTGLGIFVGIGTLWAVAMLLVAACFGLVLGGFH